jgi:ABC-2 type transport system permease protein
MTHALQAEWTKLRSVRSTTWTLIALATLSVAFSALAGAESETDGCPRAEERHLCDDDVVMNSLAGLYFGQLAVVAFAVTAMTSEYATGLIRTTFAAMPRRRTVLSAKAAAVAGLVFGIGLVTTVASYLVGRSLLAGNGFNAANGYPDAALSDLVRPLLGTALYLTALALLCVGLALLLRHTAAAITTVLGLMLLPILAPALLPEHVADQVLRFSPVTAGFAVQRTVERPDSIPIDPWLGLGVTWGYAVVAMLLAYWLIGRRDA